jgi:GT2 family glycosyltransferase
MKNNIWFVVIAYNPQKKDIDTLLDLLRGQSVLIVDNSPDHTWIQKRDVHTILNAKNSGFAGGVNQGISYALGKGADWVGILNQDISFSKAELKDFISFLFQTKARIVGPIAGALDRKRWTTILGNVPENNFDYITASFIGIHKDVIRKIGYFHEKYFMYYEDVDFCVRAARAGFLMEQKAFPSFGHDESSSLGRGSARHNYYLTRNHLLLVERLAPWRVKLYELVRSPKTTWEFLKDKNTGGLLGLKDYIFRRFGPFSL